MFLNKSFQFILLIHVLHNKLYVVRKCQGFWQGLEKSVMLLLWFECHKLKGKRELRVEQKEKEAIGMQMNIYTTGVFL